MKDLELALQKLNEAYVIMKNYGLIAECNELDGVIVDLDDAIMEELESYGGDEPDYESMHDPGYIYDLTHYDDYYESYNDDDFDRWEYEAEQEEDDYYANYYEYDRQDAIDAREEGLYYE